jgi:hypothetical protein
MERVVNSETTDARKGLARFNQIVAQVSKSNAPEKRWGRF